MDGYFTILINSTLLQEWKNTPLRSQRSDSIVALEIFAKIAVAEVVKEIPETTPDYQSALSEKVKQFAIKHAALIKREFQSGYPFAKIEKSSVEAAMQLTLKSGASLLFSHFLVSDRWILEEELNATFSNNFNPSIPYTCCLLMEVYKTGDLKAGYYLLWLIKYMGGADFAIPKKEEFSSTTLQEIVSKLIVKREVCTRPYNLIDILFASTQYPLFKDIFLSIEEKKSLYAFTSLYLTVLRQESWPNKTIITIILFSYLNIEEQSALAASLASSSDPTAKVIGTQVASALKAPTLQKALPYFNALKDQLNLPLKKIGKIFDKPLFDMSIESCLIFNVKNQVILHKDLIIGLYKEDALYLIAFNKRTEQMIWGATVPENGAPQIRVMGDNIALYGIGQTGVQLYKIESGEARLPIQMHHEIEELYFQEGSRICQKIGTILHFGRVVGDAWIKSMEFAHPGGVYKPHPTHLLFHGPDNILYIISPSGHKTKVRNCLDVIIKESKLYILEQLDKISCLSILTPTDDPNVLSMPDKVITIESSAPSIGGFCGNNHLILFDHSKGKKVTFINLDTSKGIFPSYVIPPNAKTIVHPDRKEIWCWNPATKEVWKISPLGAQLAGVLQQEGELELLHINEEGRLYFLK